MLTIPLHPESFSPATLNTHNSELIDEAGPLIVRVKFFIGKSSCVFEILSVTMNVIFFP